MTQLFLYLLNLLLALVLAPLLFGIINRTKAIIAGRHGKPLLQSYYDLAKLCRKSEVISPTTGIFFQLAPALQLVVALAALTLLPLGANASPIAFAGDFLLAVYLLGLGRFSLILAALDTGSSFEGMGASREATFSALAEPIFFLAITVITGLHLDLGATQDQAFSLSLLFGGQSAGAWLSGNFELLLLPVVFFLLLIVENCRIPVDDPTTHLELTMIHEVMILDHSGPNLALILYAQSLKLWFFASLVAGLLVPDLGALSSLLWIAVIFLVAFAIGLVEASMARLRLKRVTTFLGGAGAMAALVLIFSQMR